MQTDAEHQQHHADLGELLRECEIADEAGRAGPHHDAGEQIADERRHLQQRREVTEDHRETEAGREQGNQTDVMRHPRSIECNCFVRIEE
ncbi:hypothetical protein DM52_3126 [Burkholderia mallei]|nr:hypothetical protein DM52_3126 [Burkholderia mallei]